MAISQVAQLDLDNNFSRPVQVSVAEGTAPLSVNSRTQVANLNADMLDGKHASEFASNSHGGHIPPIQPADNSVYLRNDNTWQNISPSDIGAAPSSHSHTGFKGTGAPLEIQEWIDFHKNGSTQGHDGRLYINTSSGDLVYNSTFGNRRSGTIYHTGYKPTKSDIGLSTVPNVGFTAGQALEIGTYLDFHKQGSNADFDCRAYVDSNSRFRVVSSGKDYDINSEITNLKSSASGKWYMPSSSVRHSNLGETSVKKGSTKLIYRFVPKYNGEVRVSVDLRASSTMTRCEIQFIGAESPYISGDSTTKLYESFDSLYVANGTTFPNDYWMYEIRLAAENSSESDSDEWHTGTRILRVAAGKPVFFMLSGGSKSGNTNSYYAYCRNFRISYDEVAL